jgi:hypothetical protein
VPADKSSGRKERIYIYWLNSKNVLQSANSVAGETLYFKTADEKPGTVKGDNTFLSSTDLSVFQNTAKSQSIVFGVKKDKISPVYVSWPSK